MLDRIRRWIGALSALGAALHVAIYAGAGFVARHVLAGRTLAGQRQTEEHWVELLREVVLRSGVVACGSLGAVFLLVSVKRTREELFAFFTARQGPLALAVFRIVCFATFFVVWSPEQTLFFARLPPELVIGLPDPLPLWRLVVPMAPLAPWLVRALELCCFLAAIGLFTRAAALGVVASGFCLMGLPQVYGKVDHYHHMLWFSLILAMSPAGDALSVDALIRAARAPAGAPPPAPEPRLAYALPLRLIWILFGVIYYWAGFWKIVQHGPAWIFSDNFQNHLYLKWFEEETFRPIFRIDHYPWLCHLGAAYGAAFELSFVFLVPFKRTRLLAIMMGLFFHNATFLLFDIAFLSLQLYYLSFADWDAALAALRARLPPEGALGRGLASLRARAVEAIRAAGGVARVLELASRGPSDRGAVRGVLATGLVIITVAMGYGAVHLCDAWPFACYPTFSSLIGRETSSLVVRVESGDPGAIGSATTGAARRETFREAFRSERYAALVRAILLDHDPATRAKKLGALARVVRALDASIRPGDTIVIVEALFSTDPDVARVPLREDQLYAFRIGDDGQAKF